MNVSDLVCDYDINFDNHTPSTGVIMSFMFCLFTTTVHGHILYHRVYIAVHGKAGKSWNLIFGPEKSWKI